MTSVDSPTPTADPVRGRQIEEYVFGGLIVVLGIFTLVEAGTIKVPASASSIGPRAFPYAVGVLLVATGLAAVVATVRGKFGEQEDAEDVDADARTDWLTVVKLLAFLVAHLVLIDLVGWPVAAMLLFAGAAWTLGARPWWKVLLIAVVLSLVIQVAFASGLGLSLPAGIFEGVPLLDG
ncbi:tripartite tricarboxylate transporter TctB family protein [Umezawaea tangerina]|uniref:Putative tricarboxylic transport membrane protein n=1 Tax=Umezawaea tangerina TaxID=84725 RepID=A0A2T0SN65_9PSEU|nr:tripartite tricarboxylate transporter TctB family protein [Umezawaea tangerina]PRY34860.1 putative tricarboxylic transport membrane protein [Umezawaea tangerina]